MNCKGYGRKWSWPNLRFEPRASIISRRGATHPTAMVTIATNCLSRYHGNHSHWNCRSHRDLYFCHELVSARMYAVVQSCQRFSVETKEQTEDLSTKLYCNGWP
jgi:hypothetical protein